MKSNRFTTENGIVVYDGNELLIKGALEAGVALITGYPGSPVANVFDVIEAQQELFRAHGIKGVIANNENQSASILHGAMSVPGIRAMTVFKSVGAYVALDGLAICNYTIPEAGSASICIAGDDPALSSTQVGADSRLTFSGAKIPVLEPATNQEIKDWISVAFDLAERSQMLVGVIITTNQADGGGTVRVHPNRWPAVNMNARTAVDTSAIHLRERVSVPPNSGWLEKDLIERRMLRFRTELAATEINRIEPGASRKLGFVTSGNAYNYLQHAFMEMDLLDRFPVLKLGCTWPVDSEIVLRFSDSIDSLVVVEEKRGFVEAQIKEILRDAEQQAGGTGVERRFVPVWGKRFPTDPSGAQTTDGIPEEAGLTPTILIERLGRLLLRLALA